MKVFDIISEAEVPTGVLGPDGKMVMKTVPDSASTNAKTTTTTSSSTKTAKVPVQYDPSIPTRDKLSRGQVKQMSRTGKVTVGGKIFTKKQIAKNTALNKARLLALAKDPSKSLSKAAQKELGGAFKKSSGMFAKGKPPIEPPKLGGRVKAVSYTHLTLTTIYSV